MILSEFLYLISSKKIYSILSKRYGSNIERIHQIHSYLSQMVCFFDKPPNPDYPWDLNEEICLAVCPGRDRVFGGHTDFAGLGGSTINSSTVEELLMIAQVIHSSSFVDLNHSEEESSLTISAYSKHLDMSFPDVHFTLKDILSLSSQKPLDSILWDESDWSSYLKGCFAYLLSEHFSQHQAMRKIFQHLSPNSHLQLLIFSDLPSSGGCSSSAALTGAFSFCLNQLFNLNLSLHELAMLDYGEHFLGKKIGAADKAAILFSSITQCSMISSFPDNLKFKCVLPNHIVVLSCISPFPRLSTQKGKDYLQLHYPQCSNEIFQWSRNILQKFSSHTYQIGVRILLEQLQKPSNCNKIGISEDERIAVIKALTFNTSYSSSNSSTSVIPLLRELCNGGSIEYYLSYLKGRKMRFDRYNLIYRLLQLIPVKYSLNIGENNDNKPIVIPLRSACLYGLSETERVFEYIYCLCQYQTTDDITYLHRILTLIYSSQNGDRAVEDYRNHFKKTKWFQNPQIDSDDMVLSNFLLSKTDLCHTYGSFQRSIPDIDDMADIIHQRFEGEAEMRIAAAGLGGMVTVHCLSSKINEVSAFLKSNGFSLRILSPNASAEILV